MLSRRDFLTMTAAGAVTSAQPAKPNVLLILADDLGYECLGCYGGTSYRTPNLDRYARKGVRFNHAYSQPLCTPTRIQLMTGLYNNRNWKAFGVMDPKATTFGHRMSKAGYRTIMAGKWQMYSYNPPNFEPEWRGKGMLAKDAGFEEYNVWHALHTEDKGSRYGDPTYMKNGKLYAGMRDQYGDDIWSKDIGDFMERHKSEPVFAYYPMALTHGPFNPTPRSADWNTGKRLKNDPAYFKDMVEYMDEIVGRMMSRLEKSGQAERTLVLFFGDNGTTQGLVSMLNGQPYHGGKGLTTDAGTRVPLLAWGAGVKGGRVSNELIDSTDFLPTMLQAAGQEIPKDVQLDGRSFLPQLRGDHAPGRDAVFCWHDPRPGWDKAQFTLQIFARDQTWKLYSDGRLFHVPTDQLEKQPIKPPQDTSESKRARMKLEAVLRRYDSPRPR
jgi:arylsulfatase A-like enzyme